MKPLVPLVAIALASLGASASVIAQERAAAQFVDSKGNAVGAATLTEGPHGVLINITVKGLPPGPKGMHIHSVGTCDDAHDGFKASKGHVNPDGKEHGLMNPKGPDAGDLPNLFVHADGTAEAEVFTALVSLKGEGGRPALLDGDGAALLIHENRDDHATQPIGGAGSRIACGVVQKAQ